LLTKLNGGPASSATTPPQSASTANVTSEAE
jgi:hypothetical protein